MDMEREVVLVKMAEIQVVENSKNLKTTLGSCVGVVLHDAKKGISGLAHIMLPRKTREDGAVGKYADTAIPALLSRLLKRGSAKESLKAYLAGGANMFPNCGDRNIASVGELNVEAAKRILEKLEIGIAFEDTGGELGRIILFDNHKGEIQVKSLSRSIWKGNAG
jgi:chemotaxis protein CheD